MLDHNGLVVVADGHGATLYRNTAAQGAPAELRDEGTLGPKDLLDDGPAGSAPSDASPRDLDEATFAKQLTQRLNRMAMDKAVAQLVVVADPTTLGKMRASYHTTLERIILKEVAKNLTRASPEDVAAAIA